MTRPAYVTLPALAWIGILAWISWQRAGEDRHAALEAEALGLARLLRSAAAEAAARLEEAEARLAQRLAASARRADDALRHQHDPASHTLADIAREDGVHRIDWVGSAGTIQASAQHPPSLAPAGEGLLSGDTARRVADAEVVRAAARLAPAPGKVVTEGVRRNAFGTRERFGVALGRQDGSTLLVRADADELESLTRRFGVAALLERMRQQPGVHRVRVRSLPDASPPDEGIRVAGNVLSATTGLALAGHPPLAIEVGLDTASADRAVARTREQIVLWSLVAAGLVGAAGAWVHVRDARTRRRELELRRRAEDDRRLAEMGALAALLAHELGNPLNTIRFGLEMMERSPREAQAHHETVVAEARRMAEMLEGYMSVARVGTRLMECVSPGILESVRERTSSASDRAGVRVEIEVEDDAEAVRAEPAALEQALTNLLRNAIQVAPAGTSVELRWGHAPQGGVVIRVLDRGPGFGAERDSLFRLGVRRRQGGHGLGLPLARRFIVAAGGSLELLDRAGGGAEVVIVFPQHGVPA